MSAFADVPANHPHNEGISWAAEQGYVTGYPDGTFRPEQSLTRGQLATILYRILGPQDVTVTVSSAIAHAISTAVVDEYVTVTYPEDGGDPIVTVD